MMIKIAFYLGEYVSMSSKTTPFSSELFSIVKQLAGLIEGHLNLGATTDLHVFKSTYLHKSLSKIPTLVRPKSQLKKFVLMPSNCVETFPC